MTSAWAASSWVQERDELATTVGRRRPERRDRLVDLADLERYVAVLGGPTAGPRDGLVERAGLDGGEPGHELLRLGERPVGDRRITVLEVVADALRGRLESLAGQEHAGAGERLVVGRHGLEEVGGGEHAGLGLGVGLAEDHVAHGRVRMGGGGVRPGRASSTETTSGARSDRHAPRLFFEGL